MKLFVFAGELSADMHGARLLEALQSHVVDLKVTGVAGPRMRAAKVNPIFTIEDFSVMGFTDVLKSLPRLWKQFKKIQQHILSTQPNAVIFIDSPSFSLRMAKALRKKGYQGKIIQYISPTVWAWGSKRAQQMASDFDLLLTIYPFESAYFAHTSLPVKYIGNPVKELIQNHMYEANWEKNLGINADNLVGIFPGSRPAEILRNLPLQLEAIRFLLKDHPNIVLGISCADKNSTLLIREILQKNRWLESRKTYLIPKENSYELMKACRCAIAKSGTVTLELALHACPTVVTYPLTLLNRWIAKYWLRVKLPHYCIVNILRKKTVFPELIEATFTSKDIYRQLLPLFQATDERNRCIAECKELQKQLTGDNVSASAAREIASLL